MRRTTAAELLAIVRSIAARLPKGEHPTTLAIAYELGFKGSRGLGDKLRTTLETRLRDAGCEIVYANGCEIWKAPDQWGKDPVGLGWIAIGDWYQSRGGSHRRGRIVHVSADRHAASVDRCEGEIYVTLSEAFPNEGKPRTAHVRLSADALREIVAVARREGIEL